MSPIVSKIRDMSAKTFISRGLRNLDVAKGVAPIPGCAVAVVAVLVEFGRDDTITADCGNESRGHEKRRERPHGFLACLGGSGFLDSLLHRSLDADEGSIEENLDASIQEIA
jgi:hypothetical protein